MEELSKQVSQLETRVAAVELNLGHTRDMLGAQLKALEAGQTAVLVRLDTINQSLNSSNIRAAEAMSDPLETAAGRAVMQVVNSVVGDVGAIKRQVYMALGALAVLMMLIQIFGPSIRTAVLGS